MTGATGRSGPHRARRRRPRAGRDARYDDAGAVTAELALTLPAVVLVVAVLLVTASAVTAQLRCADGARAGARVAALGEPDAVVADVARRVAGSATEVVVHRSGAWVDVTVSVRVPGSWFTAGAVGLSATATAWREQ